MAHFAELNENNIVLRVCVVDDAYEIDGENWCADFWGGTWKQTSYNNTIRKQFAGIGFTYDHDNEVFIAPQPFPSWTLNNKYEWDPPTPQPDSDGPHYWSEAKLAWES